MTSLESYAGQTPASASNRTLTRTSLVFVMILLGTSYMFNAMDRQVFPALLGGIRTTYGLTLAQSGFASTVFSINVAIFGATSGWFLARFKRRSILVGGLIGYSLFTLLTPLAQGFVSLSAYRALTGIGEALQIATIFSCMGSYFGRSRGAAMGIMQAFFGFGALIGPIAGTRLGAWFGSWQIPMYLFGAAGILIAVAAAFLIPAGFIEATESGSGKTDRIRVTHEEVPRLLNRNVTLGSLSFALVGLAFFSYTGLYATFLREHLHYSPVAAGSALGMYGLGAMGAVVGGWAGDRLGKAGVLAGLAVLAAVSFALFNGATRPLTHALLSFVFGLMVSGFFYARFVSVIQRSAHPAQIGYAVSAAMAGFYISGPFAGFLFGKLVEIWGWSVAANVMVFAPPCIAIVLMSFFDFSRLE
ncbi:MFS transporter [Trinickia mobilis]|uniref:MFS transporter n=1 Tax=Trinickia mobilis TaxID=2816356 RepID=UPI001A8C9AAD|nr:MFS transporter [Trinickia mobilis]